MWNAIIQTLTVQIGDDSKTVEVVAEVIEGNVTLGMNIAIELSNARCISDHPRCAIEPESSEVSSAW